MYVALHEVTWCIVVWCTQNAAVSCGTSHASTVNTPLQWILKICITKKQFAHVELHASTVNLLKSRYIKVLYKSDQQQQKYLCDKSPCLL